MNAPDPRPPHLLWDPVAGAPVAERASANETAKRIDGQCSNALATLPRIGRTIVQVDQDQATCRVCVLANAFCTASEQASAVHSSPTYRVVLVVQPMQPEAALPAHGLSDTGRMHAVGDVPDSHCSIGVTGHTVTSLSIEANRRDIVLRCAQQSTSALYSRLHHCLALDKLRRQCSCAVLSTGRSSS